MNPNAQPHRPGKTSPVDFDTTSCGRSRRRGGFAMLLVLSAVAVAAVLAYSMLSAASLENRTLAYREASARAAALAESGACLAQHLLLHPDAAPAETLTTDAAGTTFYGGQKGIALGNVVENGTFDVEVTRSAEGDFVLTATGHCAVDGGEETVDHALRVVVAPPTLQTWSPLAGLHLSGTTSLSSQVKGGGGVATDGSLSDASTISGVRYAANTRANQTWTPPPAAPQCVVPEFDNFALVDAAGRYDYLGRSCQAKTLTSATLSGNYGVSTSNPLGMFIWADPRPLVIASAGAEVRGTLLVTQGGIILNGDLRVETASPSAPAMLVRGDATVRKNGADFRIQGLAYLGGLKTAAAGTGFTMRCEGLLMLGPGAGADLGPGFGGALIVNKQLGQVNIPNLLRPFDASEAVPRVTRWEEVQ